MADEQREPRVIESPLEAWPGSITLPHPDDFDGNAWRAWKGGINKPLRAGYANMHLWCYAGLELVEACGEWELSVPLGEVQRWETSPGDERTKLVAWLGRNLFEYMREITDPKG